MKKNKFFADLRKNRTNFLGAVVLVVTVSVGYFIYWPAQKRVEQYKNDLSIVNAQIERIEAMMEEGKTEAEMLALLHERNTYFNSKFPSKEEGALNALAVLAQEADVEQLSSALQPKKTCFDKNKQPIKINDKICKEIFISLKMRGSYENIINYIELLKDKLPAFVTIESIFLKSKAGTHRLDVVIELKMYTLS